MRNAEDPDWIKRRRLMHDFLQGEFALLLRDFGRQHKAAMEECGLEMRVTVKISPEEDEDKR